MTCTMLITRLTAVAQASTGMVIQKAACSDKRARCTTPSTVTLPPSVKTLQRGTNHQVPAIGHHKKQNLQRRRNHYGRELEHSDRRGNGGHDHVDHQKRQIQNGSNLESRFEFG